MITRIFTDVPQDDVDQIVNAIEADDGTFTKTDQPDGAVTIIATLPFDPPPEETPPPGVAEFPWMPVARGEIGVKETPENNPRITEYFTHTALGAQPETVPWCSAFVNFCVTEAGVAGSGSALARSWLQWGRDAGDFVPGCIVVFARGTPPNGHVGFYVGMDGARVQVLGGNQHDAVNIASFSAGSVIGRRVP
jgi:uncharacterized protein (TIGR02594 family)